MTALGSFAVGDVLTASDLNEIGVWTTYTPTLGNVTLGNGTRTAKYYKMNKIGFVSLNFTLGSTSDITGDFSCPLPSGWSAAVTGAGIALVQANGTVNPSYWRINTAGDAILVRAINVGATYAASTNFSTVIPGGNWIENDFVRFVATIELT